MKKSLLFLSKLIAILIIAILTNFFIFSTSVSNANNEDNLKKNAALIYQNNQMLNNIKRVQERLNYIDSVLLIIKKYDNNIYSQLLGINVDTTDTLLITKTNNNMKNISSNYLFKKIDEKSLYASQLASNQLKRYIETSNILKKNKYVLNLYPNISPIRTINFIELSSSFGWRTSPIYHTPEFHEGVDIAANENTNVYSTINGRVDDIVYSKYGYGNKIVIKNSNGFETLYAHLSNNIYVKKGQWVRKEQLIATVGKGGLSTGFHVHYEIRKNGKLKDPLAYFITSLNDI